MCLPKKKSPWATDTMYTHQDRHSSPAVMDITPQAPAASRTGREPENGLDDENKTPRKGLGTWMPKTARKHDHEDQAPNVSASTAIGSAPQQQGPRAPDQGDTEPNNFRHASSHPLPAPSTPSSHGHNLQRRVRSCPALVELPLLPSSQPPDYQHLAAIVTPPPCAVAAAIQAWANARKDLCCLRIVGGKRSPLLRRWIAFDWAGAFRPLIAAANELSWVLAHYRASPLCPAEVRAASVAAEEGPAEAQEEETLGTDEQDALVRIVSAATGLLCMVVQEVLTEGTPGQAYTRWQALLGGMAAHKVEMEKQAASLRDLLTRHTIAVNDGPVPATASGACGGTPEEEDNSTRDREGRNGVWGFCMGKNKTKKTKRLTWLNRLRLSLESEVLGASTTPILAVLEYQILKHRFRHVSKNMPTANLEADNNVGKSEHLFLRMNDDSAQELMEASQRQAKGTEESRREQNTIRRIESAIMAYRRFQTRHVRRSNINVVLLCNKATTAIQGYELQLKTILRGHKHDSKNLPTAPTDNGGDTPGGQGGEDAASKVAVGAVVSTDTAINVESKEEVPPIHNSHDASNILDSNPNLCRGTTRQSSEDCGHTQPQTKGVGQLEDEKK